MPVFGEYHSQYPIKYSIDFSTKAKYALRVPKRSTLFPLMPSFILRDKGRDIILLSKSWDFEIISGEDAHPWN